MPEPTPEPDVESRTERAVQGMADEKIIERLRMYIDDAASKLASEVHGRVQENFNFVSGIGDQWETKDREWREKRYMATLNMNRIHRYIEQIAGIESTSRYQPRVLDRSKEAALLAEAGNAFMTAERQRCNAEDEESDAFRDLCIGGYSWLGCRTDMRGRYPRTEEKIIPVYEMIWDPRARGRNLSDRLWHMRGKMVGFSRFKARWPQHVKDFEELKDHKDLFFDSQEPTTSSRTPWIGFKQGRIWAGDQREEVFVVEAEWKDSETYHEIDLPAFAFRALGEIAAEDLSPFGREERPDSEAPDQFLELLGQIKDEQQTREQQRQQILQQIPELQTAARDLLTRAQPPPPDETGAVPPPDPQVAQQAQQAVQQIQAAEQSLATLDDELRLLPIEIDKAYFQVMETEISEAGIRSFKLDRDVIRWAFAAGKTVLEKGRRPENAYTMLPMAGFAEKRPEGNRHYGPVDLGKDPERFSNKYLSIMIDVTARLAKGAWKVRRGAFKKISEVLRKLTRPGAVIPVDDMADIQELKGPEMPPEIRELMMIAENAVPSQMGLNPGATGDVGGDLRRISGQVVSSLEATAQRALAGLFAALRMMRKDLGRLYMAKMVTYYDREAMRQLIGPKAEELPESRLEWRRLLDLEITVDEVPTSPTEKAHTLDVLTNTALAQTFLGYYGPALGPFFVKLLDMAASDKEEMIALMESYQPEQQPPAQQAA